MYQRHMSIKKRMIGILCLCWLIPFILILGINLYYIYSNQFDTKIEKQIQQLKYLNQITVERMEKVVQSSRQATYDGRIVAIYKDLQRGEIKKNRALQQTTGYLANQYNHEDGINGAILWYKSDPKMLNSSTYNESVGASFQQIRTYWEKDHGQIEQEVERLGTSIGFYEAEGRLYLMRNIVDESYNEIATLVFLLNPEYCFQTYDVFSEGASITVELGGTPYYVAGVPVDREDTRDKDLEGNAGYKLNKGKLGIFHIMNGKDFKLETNVFFDGDEFVQLFYGYRMVVFGMAASLFPILILLLVMFRKHFTNPMKKLIIGANEVKEGNLGYQLEQEPESEEFLYLTNSFNEMSAKLKYQFDHIYEEELALRDAKIMALQSHINPHFMNNTLEIINWEARLSGNAKVSKMIEALSTVMDATIDRKKQPEVLLSEEMVYVNAYLYIISERLGKRLVIEKHIPEEILQYKVPRLILQPVIENAVEHGVVKRGQGRITISGKVEPGFLYLEITNEAMISDKEKEKIQRLLQVDCDTSKETTSGSMGIANVNQRLKILYGEPCGLYMEMIDEEHLLARIVIKIGE